MKKTLFVSIALIWALVLKAEVAIHNSLGSNMVLQQLSRPLIHGTATPLQKITLSCSWDRRTYSTHADKDGMWRINVPTNEGSNRPHQINIRGGNLITLSNVMIGEVWLCSGQSNMEMPLRGFPSQPVKGGLQEIVSSMRYKNLRLYTIGRNCAQTPQSECTGEWSVATPSSAALFSALGYMFGRRLNEVLDVPVGIIVSCYGGSRIESWVDKPTIERYDTADYIAKADKPYRDPNTLYNGMIAPLTNYTVKGFVWYQGESNRRNPHVYASMLTDLIGLWRAKWGDQKLPFIICQICPCLYNADPTGAARLMEAQFQAMERTPGACIVGTSDIGDEHFIHAPQKTILAQRVVTAALAHGYGVEGLPMGGPTFKEVVYKNGVAIVSFNNADRGLTPTGTNIDCFQLAGADGLFHCATARIGKDRMTVEVRSADVLEPIAVRFAFENWHKTNLYNTDGLPAYPFRTK